MELELYNYHHLKRVKIAQLKKILKKTNLDYCSTVSGKKKLHKVNIFFITDSEIKGLKKTYFGINRATDVISFPFVKEFIGEEVDGEVVVSLDTAARQAEERKVSMQSELVLLCVHGLLHLKGMADDNLTSLKKMRKAEFETLMRIL